MNVLRTSRNRNWLLGLLLVAGTFLVYLPVWHAGFIWDDNKLLTESPLIKAADGLYHVLGQPVQEWGQLSWSTSTHKLYQTTWYDWGWFRTTISEPQEIVAFGPCTPA